MPNAPRKRQRALMTVKGFMVPDPETPNRFTIWFAGGKLEPAVPCQKYKEYNKRRNQNQHVPHENQGQKGKSYGSLEDWQSIFSNRTNKKIRRSWKEQARLIAAKLLLGAEISDEMEENGAMKYILHRPVGGHGKSYIDVSHFNLSILFFVIRR